MTTQQEIYRGAEAANVLDSQVFKDARQRIRDGIQSQMAAVPMSDEKMHTRLILTLQLWNNLESYLEQAMQTGKLAQFQVEQEKRRFKLF